MKELNLMIIWEKARFKEKEIIEDLNKNFIVCECIDLLWNQKKFSSNLTRFYGLKLPPGSSKEKHCGKGNFLLITFIDEFPLYGYRETSKGREYVNINIFDKKILYRSWTSGGHKIHSTNGKHEIRHDLALLLNIDEESYMNKFYSNSNSNSNSNSKQYTGELIGQGGWNSFKELFEFLGISGSSYVVMRNFEELLLNDIPSTLSDVDFLVENSREFAFLINAVKSNQMFRPYAYSILVGGKKIPIDLREVSDGYYDSTWQRDILKTSVMWKSICVPNSENHLAMLVYHACIHKPNMNNQYMCLFKRNGLFGSNLYSYLYDYLRVKNYKVTYPKDISVYLNYKNLKNLNVDVSKVNLKIKFFRVIRQFYSIHLRVYLKEKLYGISK